MGLKRTELKRKTPLRSKSGLKRTGIKSSGSGSKPRARMKQKSTKTAERDRYYAKLRAVWLDGRCEAQLEGCAGQATDVHHTQGRGATKMLAVETWRALCRPCHHWVTVNPKGARDLGLSFLKTEKGIHNMNKLGTCKSCGRPIYWVKTLENRSMPLIANPELGLPAGFPDEGQAGRVQEHHWEDSLLDDVSGLFVSVLKKGEEADPELPVWLSHFVDCPHAEQHRRS